MQIQDTLLYAAQGLPAGNEADVAEEQDTGFLQLLQQFDALQESEEDRRARKSQEEAEAAAAREKQEKMNALFARIAQLRARVAACPQDAALASELSAVQTELFWLMMAF